MNTFDDLSLADIAPSCVLNSIYASHFNTTIPVFLSLHTNVTLFGRSDKESLDFSSRLFRSLWPFLMINGAKRKLKKHDIKLSPLFNIFKKVEAIEKFLKNFRHFFDRLENFLCGLKHPWSPISMLTE